MNSKVKDIIINIAIVFLICLVFVFGYLSYDDYLYYGGYSKEDLQNIFSLKDAIFRNLYMSLYFCIKQLILIVPLSMILEKTKLKKIFKIIIVLAITMIISVFYVIFNLRLVF